MKVIETHEFNNSDHLEVSGVTVELILDNGARKSVSISEGEPEDMVLFRDLSGALHIADLIQLAYEAGKAGEPYDYEFISEDED